MGRPLAIVCHENKKDELREFAAKYKNVVKKFNLVGTQIVRKIIVKEVFEGEDVSFSTSGPYELIDAMKDGKIGGAIFFRDETAPNLHVEALAREAVVHNVLSATTPATSASVAEVLREALKGKGKPELLPSFFFTMRNPALEAYEKRMKLLAEKSKKNKKTYNPRPRVAVKKETNHLQVPRTTGIEVEQRTVVSARSA